MDFLEIFSYLREPVWLLLTLTPILIVIIAYLFKKQHTKDYCDPKLSDWVKAGNTQESTFRYWQLIFIQLAWLAFAIAVAGPRLPEKIYDLKQSYDKEVMVVVDVSFSMSGRDIAPSRIERSKLELFDLIDRLTNTKMGLVVYAGRPHLLSPPTTDKTVLRHYVKLLRTQLTPTEGSNLFHAINFSNNYFSQSSISQPLPRAIIVLTDGEINLPQSDVSLALNSLSKNLKKNNTQLYVLGIGTIQGSPLLSEHSGWLESENQAIISRLNNKFLSNLANTGNGTYSALQDDDTDWKLIYDNGVAKLTSANDKQTIIEQVKWIEYYHWFIITGLIFTLFGLSRPSFFRVRATAQSIILFSIASIILSAANPLSVHAATDTTYQSGFKKFKQGDYRAATQLFSEVPGYIGRFAEGVTHYHLKQYQQAIPLFIQAILDANTDQQRVDAIFNLANCYFKLERYDEAAQLYRDVLHYQANFSSAQINLDYALALIKEQKSEERITAKRQGSGPSTAETIENIDITTGKLSLGESTADGITQNTIDQAQPGYSPNNTNLELSAPASEKIEQHKDESWTYDVTSITQLRQLNLTSQTDESILWQRMFEFEENYQAAQEQPNVIPGVKPW